MEAQLTPAPSALAIAQADAMSGRGRSALPGQAWHVSSESRESRPQHRYGPGGRGTTCGCTLKRLSGLHPARRRCVSSFFGHMAQIGPAGIIILFLMPGLYRGLLARLGSVQKKKLNSLADSR